MARTGNLQRTLRATFGLERLRPAQREVIEAVLDGQDVLAIMATGAGKSLCYQLPALHLPGMTLVVSPLIALMKDQADKLQECGLAAEVLNSSLTTGQEADVLRRVRDGTLEFLLTTPERLATEAMRAELAGVTVDLLVVDEAHCISRWGHDFRPGYLQLGEILQCLGHPPVLALTATATAEVIDDIRAQLGRPALRVMNTTIYRPNLHLFVQHVTRFEEKMDVLREQLGVASGSAIVYAATTQAAERIDACLREAGLPSACYHGRLPARLRHARQDQFMDGTVPIIVATSAFGMGIDKSDIRCVMHAEFPGTVDAYYQEAGRAGRDGETATCRLLYDLNDRRVQQHFLAGKHPAPHQVEAVFQALRAGPLPAADLQRRAGRLSARRLEVIVAALRQHELLEGDATALHLTDTATRTQLETVQQGFAAATRRDREALQAMMHFAQSTTCRWRLLLEYFHEQPDFEHCGRCDNCLHPIA